MSDGRRSLAKTRPPLEAPIRERAPTVETIIEEDSDGSEDNPPDAREERASTCVDPTPLPGEGHDNPGQDGPEDLRELEELRQWYNRTKEKEELQALRLAKTQYEAGDSSMFPNTGILKNTVRMTKAMSSSLPRPEPPYTYSKKNRVDYNRWERDCEGFFLRSPINFVTEAQKIEFGTRYISETLKSLWISHCESQIQKTPLWVPDWANVKQVMLGALGTPAERQQSAYDQLKRCKQRTGQSPTDLLDYMRPLWAELEIEKNPKLKVLEFIGALTPQIQKDLFLLPTDRRDTLAAVEEQANVIYRRNTATEPQNRWEKPKKQPRGNTDAEGDGKPQKKARHSKGGQFGTSRPNKSDSSTVTCWGCGKTGHYQLNCRSKEQTHPKDARDKPSLDEGKDRGSRN
jgi:hypothetical protein